VNWKDRSHFFAVAADAIRRVLVDHARVRNAAKRRAPGERLTIHADLDAAVGSDLDLLGLDEALTRLAELNQRQAKVVELRFFAGLTVEETAAVLGVSEGTVKGDWRMARAWLALQLDPEGR
jgi:RNA polymerase sigma factor (TIGR02999 family)